MPGSMAPFALAVVFGLVVLLLELKIIRRFVHGPDIAGITRRPVVCRQRISETPRGPQNRVAAEQKDDHQDQKVIQQMRQRLNLSLRRRFRTGTTCDSEPGRCPVERPTAIHFAGATDRGGDEATRSVFPASHAQSAKAACRRAGGLSRVERIAVLWAFVIRSGTPGPIHRQSAALRHPSP